MLSLLCVVVWIGTVGAAYPYPSILAALGASVGLVRFIRRHRSLLVASRAPTFADELFAACLLWGLPFGGLAYAVLAGLGIGVPDPTVALGWRVFGGLVLGMVAGLAAGMVLPLVLFLSLVGRALVAPKSLLAG
jgi:hypothetical protein